MNVADNPSHVPLSEKYLEGYIVPRDGDKISTQQPAEHGRNHDDDESDGGWGML